MPVYPELTDQGLTTIDAIQHLENMQEGIAGSSEFGATVSTGPYSVTGQILGVVAAELGELNELDQGIYDSGNPENAQGQSQDNIQSIRGLNRQDATASSATVDCTGTGGTPIPAGSLVKKPDSDDLWETQDPITLPDSVLVKCLTLGPVEALATSISVIFTPISGWSGVNNPLDAEPGEPEEQDPEFYVRGERSLSRTGSSTDQAMRARIEDNVTDVEAAAVRSNRSSLTTVDGQPPSSIWIAVFPDTVDEDELAIAIWGDAGAPQGIEMYGAQSKGIKDNQDYTQIMYWDWGAAEDVHIKVWITTKAGWPADGQIQAKNAVFAFASLYTMGQNVDGAPIQNAVQDVVPGISIISATQKIGGTPVVTDTAPVEIAFQKVAQVQFANITIAVV